MAEEQQQRDVKPGDHLAVQLRDQHGDLMHFKVKKTTKLSKIFDAYAGRKGQTAAAMRFIAHGANLHPNATVAESDIEEGDYIDVMMEMAGGGRE